MLWQRHAKLGLRMCIVKAADAVVAVVCVRVRGVVRGPLHAVMASALAWVAAGNGGAAVSQCDVAAWSI